MARKKPAPVIIIDLQQAEGAMAEIAELERTISTIENQMNEVIDNARTRAKEASAEWIARRNELGNALAVFAQHHKGDLFAKRKSMDLGFGTIGFRQSTSLKTERKVTVEMVLERCRNYGFSDAIQTKESLNKQAMHDWPDERLATVGMVRQVKDDFFYEIHKQDLDTQAA
ncbi:host-nuclease inhibitor protein Gam [Oleidesulfovibrio alaskensis G20]|jgi:phage host-nuclease inhibitor protein Gam|uniref:Host-nuclease inhibitor protein Gam n=1 Tax=Oleidesulfovibrio alaskensis (strain ATCC BAA-1058 / DSM 17464 / G20) TaxID=207559 RepID=Q30VZ8_OLEA2|nr:host-nuclease inhibitor Gam family protein [Oleidesulfovibrio alaskensis]ABB40148.1 host-nuclease inhibitor protein Gam [Oleidesulfovibrio alaskensis G20]MBL3580879.1 host-nuclease inhibitor Gam family protein [Oleidesulfovibrio alaskensis]MBL3587980.1 host-nuclease inhibitor Gam family protein [bacterium]